MNRNLSCLFDENIKDAKPQHRQDFLDYWTEKTINGKKERWQLEKVFDVRRRFATWMRNHKTNFGKNPLPVEKQPEPKTETIPSVEHIIANEEMTAHFHNTISGIQEDISPISYDVWIKPILVIDVTSTGAFMLHHDTWKWVKEHYQELLEKYAGCKVTWFGETK